MYNYEEGIPTLQKNSAEILSGRLILLPPCSSNDERQNVIVSVYQTSNEHFAIVYPESYPNDPLCCFNLRCCSIERFVNSELTAFMICQNSLDAPVCTTFLCQTKEERDRWVNALTNKLTPLRRHSFINPRTLPSVKEQEEYG